MNILPLEKDEHVTAMIPMREFEEGKYLTMVTKRGFVKKTALNDYASNRKGGLIAIGLREDDELISVNLTDGSQSIIIGTKKGMCIRFAETDVRPMGRGATGVTGIRMKDEDYVIGASVCDDEAVLLTITENGFGKKTPVSEYKIQFRGGKGVTGYKITDKTGLIAGMSIVTNDNDVMIITTEGVVIRTDVAEISEFGRVTQGVRVMKLDEGVKIKSIEKTAKEEEKEENEESAEENQ